MKQLGARILVIGVVVAVPVMLLGRLAPQRGPRLAGLLLMPGVARAPLAGSPPQLGGARLTPITIDYPEEGSIFPPELTAPTFLWRDGAKEAVTWRIKVTFSDGSADIEVKSPGERMRVGEIDPRCLADTNEPPKLTPEQAAARTWTPDAATWAEIKKHSVERPATVTVTGLRDDNRKHAVSRGQVVIQTSKDPVGAPIFYRDVPLMPSELEKGVIKPLAPAAIPLIAWRLRNIGEPRSRVLMQALPTCANCHSFSANGAEVGMDLDGPHNDKGLYGIAAIKPHTVIRDEDVITWNPTGDRQIGQDRVGFMSQLSPDGRYVVTTVNSAGKTIKRNFYVVNFKDYRFLQVFYPTGGILAYYDRAAARRRPLPGANDPRYVQTDGVWSPDGKYVVFARAETRDAYPEGVKLAEYANDPKEVQIQYDLYRMPFNEGKGGQPTPLAGASGNGMSNTFPKVSPDGRWIVFVQCRNGQLMRPDSQLYIIPARGGQARRMRCNTPLMNSWHSFSPNGRWLVFSSKSRSPYTQMYLTHLDEEGNDSPPILIENSTAANRAVNIPEFVNIPPDGLLEIDTPALEFYRLFDVAWQLAEKGDDNAAIAQWKKILQMSPDDAKAHNNLGVALARLGKYEEAVPHYQKALQINPDDAKTQNNLGVALARLGRSQEAIPHFERALAVNPDLADAHDSLGRALAAGGRLDEALPHFERAVALNAASAEFQSHLGRALIAKQRYGEAIPHFEKALEISPDLAEAQEGLGSALAAGGRLDEAIPHFEKAVALNPGSAEFHNDLGRALIAEERYQEALVHFEKALASNPRLPDAQYYVGVSLYYFKRDAAAALAHWREGLRADPNHLLLLDQTAWALATCPDASVRSGSEAVELAQRAAQAAGGQNPAVLDTLAAAYAEAGRFPEAAETARQALTLATQQNLQPLMQGLKARIALYEAKTAFRETRQRSP